LRTPQLSNNAAIDAIAHYDPQVGGAIIAEQARQVSSVDMIPSENYTYPEVLAGLGSVLTNKHSEGYPGRCYHSRHVAA
jgi:glycine hydroxymethyltransferase